MANLIDVDALLTALPGDSPCGVELRKLPDFARMEEAARSEEVANLGDWRPENPKTADWKAVLAVASEAIATKSKDLRAVVRLGQALCNLHGLEGAADGIHLARRLAEDYWPSLHPLIEDGDDDLRRTQFDQLGNRLYQILALKPIAVAVGNQNAYSYTDYVVSKETDQLRKRATSTSGDREVTGEQLYQAARQDGRPASEDFQPVMAATPIASLLAIYSGAKRCSAELAALSAKTDELMKNNEPSYKALKEMLDGLEKLVGTTLRDRSIDPDAEPSVPATPTGEPLGAAVGDGGNTPGPAGSFAIPTAGATGRAQALAALTSISNYFKAAEPHSPIPLLLDRAIKWAAMPLPQMLVEMVEDETALRNIDKLLGIKRD